MPAYPYQRISELRNQKNPRIAEVFFQMSEEDIVKALVNLGYSEDIAKRDAAQFVAYRASLTTGQTFGDNETEAAPVEEQEYRGFGQSIADMKKKEG